ncbi:hypothetical protein APSETT445_000270 [Aspergillus pseudonomiae]
MSHTVAFVTGATGHQGGATARELLKSGVKVHALVRDPSSQSAAELQRLGVQLFPGDFGNLSSLKAAVEGVTAVFLNVSPSLPDTESEVIHTKNIIDAAAASGTVTTIVYSSVTMTGKHEESTMTVLDPGDVGKFAAAAIVNPAALNKHEIDLGVESLTPAEIVRELSRVSGKEARDLAVRDPRLYAQLWTNEVGYQVNFKELEKYPIRLTKFSEYLAKHQDEVLEALS